LKKLPLVTKSPQTIAPCKEEEDSVGAAAPQITRKPRSFFPFSISCRGSLAPPVSSFFTLETTPKVQDKEVRNRKKSKCYTRDYSKLAPSFWFSQVKRKREREREIQTGRSKPKASRYEET
jgi:hypothetical protein